METKKNLSLYKNSKSQMLLHTFKLHILVSKQNWAGNKPFSSGRDLPGCIIQLLLDDCNLRIASLHLKFKFSWKRKEKLACKKKNISRKQRLEFRLCVSCIFQLFLSVLCCQKALTLCLHFWKYYIIESLWKRQRKELLKPFPYYLIFSKVHNSSKKLVSKQQVWKGQRLFSQLS